MTTSSDYHSQSVREYFDDYGLNEWERLVKTPVDEVSLHIHSHYLRRFISPGARVLEIGAGAGRFTQVLAEIDAQVVVGDISPGQLALNRRAAAEYGFEDAVLGWKEVDICDLSMFEEAHFDSIVVYGGPFSYVLDQRDRALQECVRVLKPGSHILLSVMSLWGSVHRHLDGTLDIPARYNQKITHSGDLSASTYPDRQGSFMHLFRAGELRDFLTQAGLNVAQMSASNCLSLRWEEHLTSEIRQDAEKWAELLRMEREACASHGCVEMGTHMIAIASKA